MTVSKKDLFSELFNNFFDITEEVLSVIVSDKGGLIIAGEKRKDIDMEIISVLTAIINPILERIRNEFAFKKFGTASFDTDEHRLLFISVDENITLSLVIDSMASVDKLSPYAYFLTEKAAQIIYGKEDERIQLTIPNFEYDGESPERLKNQIYQMRLESGGVYRFKFIVLGDHEVGKTSIIRRYVDKKFYHDYRATIGLNILMHRFEFYGNEINLSLWDIGAQKYFKRFRKTYYMGSQAVFIVFDLTNLQSYEHVTEWFEELAEFIQDKDIPIVIVGNKTDLKEERVISYQEGVELATRLSEKGVSKISYIETSALTGENVDDSFSLISYHYIMKSKEREEDLLKKDLLGEIIAIIEYKGRLEIAFISENPFWSPGIQILTELKQLGEYSKLKDDKEEKIYKYANNLTLKNFLYEVIDVSTSDGAFCIFDARSKIDPIWRELVIRIIENIQENKVILVGIRVSESTDWSEIMEQFDVNDLLEQKMISLLFFKIGMEYRLEIYDQLIVMLNTIKNIG